MSLISRAVRSLGHQPCRRASQCPGQFPGSGGHAQREHPGHLSEQVQRLEDLGRRRENRQLQSPTASQGLHFANLGGGLRFSRVGRRSRSALCRPFRRTAPNRSCNLPPWATTRCKTCPPATIFLSGSNSPRPTADAGRNRRASLRSARPSITPEWPEPSLHVDADRENLCGLRGPYMNCARYRFRTRPQR